MFEASADDYHELNAGAQRNSPENLYAPTLTWHLAFWINKASSATPIDDLKTKLDTLLLDLCKALQTDDTGSITDVRLFPCVSGVLLLFEIAAYESSFLQISREQLTKRQTDILTSNSRSVSLKFKFHELCLTIRCEMHTEYFSVTTFAAVAKDRVAPFSNLQELNETITKAFSYFNRHDVEENRAVVEKLNKYFFRTFWDSYSAHVLGYIAALFNDGIFKPVFADFRGIVLSDEATKLDDNGFFYENKPPSWGIAAKKTFLPLLNVATRRQYECTVTYMLDGRAMYMSALAPQIPEHPDIERIPLEFIVYVHQRDPNCNTLVNNRQLGRLVHQLHLLGTLRLAALKNVKFLHAAGTQLSDIDQSIQSAREQIVGEDTDAKRVIDSIKVAQTTFNDINNKFRNNAHCGLLYRIAQSRYYVDQFRSNVKMLRLMRLEGEQPYDQFVERRLGPEFDFIDRLGKRYERAANSILMLDQNYLSIRTNQLDDDTKKIDDDIRKIQAGGEFALLAALVPYYLTQLSSHVVQEKFMFRITIAVWTVLIVIAFYMRAKKKMAERSVGSVHAHGHGVIGNEYAPPQGGKGENAQLRQQGRPSNNPVKIIMKNLQNPNKLAGVVLVGLIGAWLAFWQFDFLHLREEQNEQIKEFQSAVLKTQDETNVLLNKLLNVQDTQSALLKAQKDLLNELLNVQKVAREKKKEAGSRLLPKHPKRSVR